MITFILVHGSRVQHAGSRRRIPAIPGCHVGHPDCKLCSYIDIIFYSVEEEGEYEEELPPEDDV